MVLTRSAMCRLILEIGQPSCLSGAIAVGFGLGVYEGGSVEELEACAQSLYVTALYALHDGVYVPCILGAPDPVNQPFRELFPDGVPALSALLVQSEGPLPPAPTSDDILPRPWHALDEGEFVSYIVRAPEFVNQTFRELFAEGVSALTPLVVRSDGPPLAQGDGNGDASN